MKSAGWSTESTFARFHDKPVSKLQLTLALYCWIQVPSDLLVGSCILVLLFGILFPLINTFLLVLLVRVTGLSNLMWLRSDVDWWQVRNTWLNETYMWVEVWSRFYLVISLERRSHMPLFLPSLPPSFLFSCTTHFDDWLAMRMRISWDKIESRSNFNSQVSLV